MTAPQRIRIPDGIASRAAQYAAEAPEDEIPDLAARRVESWLNLCPLRFHDATLWGLDHPDDTRSALGEWVDQAIEREAENLLLLGPIGRGKTFAALACARSVFVAGHSVRFVPVVEMFDALRPDGGGSPEDYLTPDVLVLDDLGGEKPSEWTVERLYLVINRRWLDRKPVIVTTNLEPEALKEAVGERILDRIRDGATAVRLGGEQSRRGRG